MAEPPPMYFFAAVKDEYRFVCISASDKIREGKEARKGDRSKLLVLR